MTGSTSTARKVHCPGVTNRLIVLAAAFAVLLSACTNAAPSGSPPVSSPPPVSSATHGPSTVPLECETDGYPCSLGTVPDDVTSATEVVAQGAADRLRQGATFADVANWVRGQSNIAETQSGEDGIRFRLTGGRPYWLFDTGGGSRNAALVPLAPALASGPIARLASLFSIAGGDTEKKRGLVLSPVQWDFGADDDGSDVAATLGATRGYDGGVTFLANADPTSATVGVESFRGWRDYNAVHVVSHGTRLCDPPPCRAVIAAQVIPGRVKTIVDVRTRGLILDATGADLGQSSDGRRFVMLGADFFRHEYRGGLTDTVVFLNGCSTLGAEGSDLADAIAGQTSVVVGWTDTVESRGAGAAGRALWTRLADGVPVRTAVDGLGPLGSTTFTTDRGRVVTAKINVAPRRAGGDLRIREIVRLGQPGGGVLAGGSTVQIHGQLADGLADLAPYRVEIDGLAAAEAAKTILHVSIGGHEAPPVTVSTGTATGPESWILEGEIPLGVDLIGSLPADERAWVDLPDSGNSSATEQIVLDGVDRCPAGDWSLDLSSMQAFIAGVMGQASEIEVSGSAILTLAADGHMSIDYRGLTATAVVAENPRATAKIVVNGGGLSRWKAMAGVITFSEPAVSVNVDASITVLGQTTSSPILGPEAFQTPYMDQHGYTCDAEHLTLLVTIGSLVYDRTSPAPPGLPSAAPPGSPSEPPSSQAPAPSPGASGGDESCPPPADLPTFCGTATITVTLGSRELQFQRGVCDDTNGHVYYIQAGTVSFGGDDRPDYFGATFVAAKNGTFKVSEPSWVVDGVAGGEAAFGLATWILTDGGKRGTFSGTQDDGQTFTGEFDCGAP